MDSAVETVSAEVSLPEEEIAGEEMAEAVVADERPLELPALVCAIIFSCPKPVSLAQLEEACSHSSEEVEEALNEVRRMFSDDVHGFSLYEVNGGYQFRTTSRAAKAITKVLPPKLKRLSRAAAETLAVIAYKQPVQRAEIEAIRGVDALPTLRTLLDAKLVRIVGHEDTVGQPALYGTTTLFLERFGLNDLSDLPSVREIEQLMADPGEEHEALVAAEEVGGDAAETSGAEAAEALETAEAAE